MAPELVAALVSVVVGIPPAVYAGTRAVWKVAITDRIKAADDRAREATADRDVARAERDAFKHDWKEAVANGHEIRRRYERALGLPVSQPPPGPRSEQPTLVGYELHRGTAAFVEALEAQEKEREIPTRPETPDPDKTPRAKGWPRIMVDDARRARDPSEGRAVPLPRRKPPPVLPPRKG